jgi:hypothetical protein
MRSTPTSTIIAVTMLIVIAVVGTGALLIFGSTLQSGFTRTAAPSQPVDPNVTAKIAYIQPKRNSGFSALGYIANPNPYPLLGIVTRWDAYDESGKRVEFGRIEHQTIPASTEQPYVVDGHRRYGETNQVARIEVMVVNSGRQTENEPPVFTIDTLDAKPVDKFVPSGRAPGPSTTRRTHDIDLTLSTPNHEVTTQSVVIGIVARDPSGAIMAFQPIRPVRRQGTAKPGAPVRADAADFLTADGFVDTIDKAARFEAFAYVDRDTAARQPKAPQAAS